MRIFREPTPRPFDDVIRQRVEAAAYALVSLTDEAASLRRGVIEAGAGERAVLIITSEQTRAQLLEAHLARHGHQMSRSFAENDREIQAIRAGNDNIRVAERLDEVDRWFVEKKREIVEAETDQEKALKKAESANQDLVIQKEVEARVFIDTKEAEAREMLNVEQVTEYYNLHNLEQKIRQLQTDTDARVMQEANELKTKIQMVETSMRSTLTLNDTRLESTLTILKTQLSSRLAGIKTFAQQQTSSGQSRGERAGGRQSQSSQQQTPRAEATNGHKPTNTEALKEVAAIVGKAVAHDRQFGWLKGLDPKHVLTVVNTVKRLRSDAAARGETISDREIYIRYRRKLELEEASPDLNRSFRILIALLGGGIDGTLPF